LPTSHGFVPVPKEGQELISHPLPPSSNSAFVTLFEFVGTIDNCNYGVIPTAYQFRQNVCGGEKAIHRYCSTLVKEGSQLVASILGTQVMETEPVDAADEVHMINVELPVKVPDDIPEAKTYKFINELCLALIGKGTFIATYYHAGKLWVRLSGQIYLDLEDFRFGGEVLKETCKEILSRKGDL
jgi:hypothetical protein